MAGIRDIESGKVYSDAEAKKIGKLKGLSLIHI